MNDHRVLPAIARAGTAVASIGPSRSRTDPVESRQDPAVMSGRAHANTITGKAPHSSSHQHHHTHQRHRDKAKETVQLAMELKPPISLDHLLRRERKSPDSSRRGSASQAQRENADSTQRQQREMEEDARRRVKIKDVAKARKDNERREEELRLSLQHVEELGMSSTRQLDDTYYAILEKASILRSTVMALQNLAEESRRLHCQFEDDTKTLQRETKSTIDGFGQLSEQEKTINEFISKLQSSKIETQKLNERLETARNRIEVYERRECARQSKRRKQWHATWGTLVGVVVLILVVILLKNHRDVARKLGTVGKTFVGIGDRAEKHFSLALQPVPSPSEDPYLQKLFDEL